MKRLLRLAAAVLVCLFAFSGTAHALTPASEQPAAGGYYYNDLGPPVTHPCFQIPVCFPWETPHFSHLGINYTWDEENGWYVDANGNAVSFNNGNITFWTLPTPPNQGPPVPHTYEYHPYVPPDGGW